MFKRYKKLLDRVRVLEAKLGLMYDDSAWVGGYHEEVASGFVHRARKRLSKLEEKKK